MKRNFSDRDVLRLLASLKRAEGDCPAEVIRSRRKTFVKQTAAMAALVKSGEAGTNLTGGGSSSGVGGAGTGSSSMGIWLDMALAAAIVVEAGMAAYIYRDRIADFVNLALFPNKVEHVGTLPDGSPLPILVPEGAGTAPSAATSTVTVIAAATGTPAPPSFAPDTVEKADEADSAEIHSTPAADDQPGLRLGQTPKPERTLPPNNDNTGNNDKLPNQNKLPSDKGKDK
jgi:hypothetical protein